MRFYVNPRNWPIMLKISMAVLVASLIPVMVMAYYNLNVSLRMIEDSEYRNIELLARAVAERLDQLMTDNEIAATQLSSDTEIIALVSDPTGVPDAVRASVSASLTRILTSNPQYEYVYLMDKKGDVIISRQLAVVPTLEGQNLASRAYFSETMKGTPYVDALVSRTTQSLGFYFTSPVLDEKGLPVGVAVVKLKGEAITSIVSAFKSGQTGFAFLVDQNGVVVSHPDPAWSYSSLMPLEREVELKIGQRFGLAGCEDAANLDGCAVRSLKLPNLEKIILGSNEPRHSSYRSPGDKSEQIVGAANTTELNWVVVVNESKSEFTAPLNSLALRTLMSVLVIGTLAVAGGILLARFITRPLGQLSEVAKAVQNGETPELDALADVMEQGDEVGHLALIFNGMINSLHARVGELHAINMVSRKISSSFNIGTTLTLVLNSMRSVVPFDRALVMLYDPDLERFCTRAIGDGRGFYTNRVWNEEDTPAYHSQREGFLRRYFEKRKNKSLSVLEPDMNILADSVQKPEYPIEWGGREYEARAYLGVPLMFKDDIVGVVELVSSRPWNFSPDHVRVLELIAGQAGVAVRNALDVERREAELRKQIDELQIVVDEGKKQKNVEEIVESDFFQALSSKADEIRLRRQGGKAAGSAPEDTGALGGVGEGA